MVTDTVGGKPFHEWLDENYLFRETPPSIVCIRCGMTVEWVTKHAVIRHGDDIDIIDAVDNDRTYKY